jgi:hypothetical protein
MFRPEATSAVRGTNRCACATTYTCRPGTLPNAAALQASTVASTSQRLPAVKGSASSTSASSAKIRVSAAIGPRRSARRPPHRLPTATDTPYSNHPAHRIGAEAADVLQERRQEGEGGERAAVADRGHRIHQLQA